MAGGTPLRLLATEKAYVVEKIAEVHTRFSFEFLGTTHD
jgi:hypothetical protein